METKRYYTDDRVKFDLDGKNKGTGTILGMSGDYIIQWYIILLDEMIQGQKAIVVPSPCLTLEIE